jgi:VWFA-related protein
MLSGRNSWHPSRSRRAAIWIALAVLLTGLKLPANAQKTSSDQDDVIRVTTNLIQVRAVVTDRKGQVVDGLKQEDFEILENDRPQKVSFFSLEKIPSDSDKREPAQRKSEEREEPSTRARPSRSIVLFVDTLHLSNIGVIRAKEQLKKFVNEQIADGDRVAVVTTSGELGILQQFMSDRRRLAYVIDKITGIHRPTTLFTPYLAAKVLQEPMPTPPNLTVGGRQGTRSANTSPNPGNPVDDARAVAQAILSGESDPTDPFMKAREILSEESMLRRASLAALQEASEHLATMPGQRLMMFVSNGFTLLSEAGGADRQELAKATSSAVRSGVVIYSFNPEGLTTPAEYTAASPVQFDSSQPTLGASFSALMAESRTDQQSNLRSLAGDTGGAALLNSNDINTQLQKVLDANRIYYALAYYPEGETDRKFRNLKVRVRDHPDYKVRIPRGYQPGEAKTTEVAKTAQERLLQAMMEPMPLTAIEVTSSALFLPRKDDEAQVTLQVHFAGDQLTYNQSGENYSMRSEVAVVVLDRSGKMAQQGMRPIGGTFTAAQLEPAKRNGYRYSERLKLRPGFYQIRIGVRDANNDGMGTATAWIDVPDMRNRKMVLSSLFLGRTEEAGKAAENSKSAQLELVVGAATIKATEPIFYRYVLYNASPSLDPMVDLWQKTEVMRLGKSVYEGEWQPLSTRIVRLNPGAIEVGGKFKLGVEPGVYSVQITVKDRKSGDTASQTIDVEIKP